MITRHPLFIAGNHKPLLLASVSGIFTAIQRIKIIVDQIEQLKQKMVQVLIQHKRFHSSRHRDHWFLIAIDGSGTPNCMMTRETLDKAGQKTFKDTSYYRATIRRMTKHTRQKP